MEEKDGENLDTLNKDGESDTNQGGDENTGENEGEGSGELDIEELKKKAALADNYKIRAEKAEGKLKTFKPAETTVKPQAKTEGLSQADMLAVLREKVTDEDLTEVQDYAALKKISVADALKTPFIKSLLSEKEELRKTAAATNTGTSTRGTSKVSDEVLVDKAQKGEMPDGDEDIQRLWRIRKGLDK